jgi:FAD/FMN-containing dehydrogenase
VRNGDAARAFAAQGLAFPLGHCASVPLSGYLLGGGFGWNSGQWGIACFSVESIDVVLADGELRRASETENADIFWAARGGGPEFFGVVTAYRLRLQPLPRAITTSVWTYRIDRAPEIEGWMRDAVTRDARNVEFTAVFSSAPPHLADRTRKTASAIATVFADSVFEARAMLARIGASAPAGALEVRENMTTPFEVLYEIIAPFFPVGYRYAVDSFWAPAHADSFLARLAAETMQAPAPRSFSLGVVLPPQSGPLPDGAFSMTGAAFGCAYAIWDDVASDSPNMDWLRQTSDRIAPLSIGAYVGEADLDRPARLQQCYSPTAWAALKALQSVYDPHRMFGAHRSITMPLQSAA